MGFYKVVKWEQLACRTSFCSELSTAIKADVIEFMKGKFNLVFGSLYGDVGNDQTSQMRLNGISHLISLTTWPLLENRECTRHKC